MTIFRCAALSVVKHDYIHTAVAAHPRFEFVVVADEGAAPDWVHDRNRLFAEQQGVPYIPDVGQALAEFDLEVAVVSSEAERHCRLSQQAAHAGLHVIQDKPMATQTTDCDAVVQAIEDGDLRFLLWNRNYLPALLQARQAVESGALGQLTAIHADFYFAKDAGCPQGTRAEGEAPVSWLEHQIAAHADGSDGGVGEAPMGELAIEGIYPLAYLRMLTGAEVRRVFARTTSHFHQLHADHDVEDLATVTLEMEGGLVGSLCIGRIGAASHPDLGEIKLHLVGTRAALVVTEARPEIGIYYRGQPEREFRHRRIANQNDALLLDNFAAAIDSRGKPSLDARDGKAICQVVDAALASSRSGLPVEVGKGG